MEIEQKDRLVAVASDLVAAYVAHNHVQVADLPVVIRNVHATLVGLAMAGPTASAIKDGKKLSPAEIRRSITPDGLISFEDGKPYKTLKRHLTIRGLSPDAYRAKWGLPGDYPMTAVSYSAARSRMALDRGLGRLSIRQTDDPDGHTEVFHPEAEDDSVRDSMQMAAEEPDAMPMADGVILSTQADDDRDGIDTEV